MFEIRDIWSESIIAVGLLTDSIFIKIIERLELFLYKNAAHIIVVTHDFARILNLKGIDSKKIDVVTNGSDLTKFKKIPNKIKLINCVGGGSSAYGFWSEFIDFNKKQIELIGVEAGGPEKSKLHAAPLSRNAKIVWCNCYLKLSLTIAIMAKTRHIAAVPITSPPTPIVCYLIYWSVTKIIDS